MRPDAVSEARDGLVAIIPAVVAVVPFGLLLGALASQAGLTPLEVMLMSALVFAGSAQFVAVELWSEPAPWLLLTVSAMLVNCRHLLLGASLAPRMSHFPTGRSFLALYVLVDEVWALSEQRAMHRRLSFAYMFTMGVVLWLNWVGTTTLGAALGASMGDPATYGFDFALAAIFITLIVGLWRGSRTGVAVAASGCVASVVYLTVPGPWYIAAGGLAGALAGALHGPVPETEPEPAE